MFSYLSDHRNGQMRMANYEEKEQRRGYSELGGRCEEQGGRCKEQGEQCKEQGILCEEQRRCVEYEEGARNIKKVLGTTTTI